ncbi:MAG TPA: alanine racemase C-terminal domain-containing protein [Terrimesophilobacter sp.]|nr:alanine racemase C-terminal domain-containing protein [Terrimesophilobacter sp.]
MSDQARVLELSTRLLDLLELLPGGRRDVLDAVRDELGRTQPRLTVELLSVKAVPAGAGVSYGHTFVTPEATTLALAAMGYGDGMPRKAGNRAHVSLAAPNAKRLPIVGRVAMNAFVIDTGAAQVRAGDRAVVFGDPDRGELSLSDWAARVGETPVSVLVSVAAKVTLREVP